MARNKPKTPRHPKRLSKKARLGRVLKESAKARLKGPPNPVPRVGSMIVEPQRHLPRARAAAAYTDMYRSAQLLHDACYELSFGNILSDRLYSLLRGVESIVKWGRLKAGASVADEVERQVYSELGCDYLKRTT